MSESESEHNTAEQSSTAPSAHPRNATVARRLQARAVRLMLSCRERIAGERSLLRRLRDRLWGYDFFISYDWQTGGAYAQALERHLKDRGFDVFLDRTEFAGGDNWTSIGVVALANTQRLILIATEKAVFHSDPVSIEVCHFSASGRTVIPIFFKSRFSPDQHAQSPVLKLVPPQILGYLEPADRLLSGPSDDAIAYLTTTSQTLRRRSLRRRLLGGFVLILVAALVAVSFSLVTEREARRQARRSLSNSDLSNARFALNEHRLDDALIWLGSAIEHGPPNDPLVQSARRLLGAWSSEIRSTVIHKAEVTTCAFSPDSRVLATASADGVVMLNDAQTGATVGCPMNQQGQVLSLAFTRQGDRLASGSGSVEGLLNSTCGFSRVWDARTGEAISESLDHGFPVCKVLFSQNGKYLLTSSLLQFAKLFDAEAGFNEIANITHSDEFTIEVDSITGETQTTFAATFNPDDTQVVTGGVDGKVRFWKVPSGAVDGESLDQNGSILDFAFSPDGKKMAVVTGLKSLDEQESRDGGLRLWDLETHTELSQALKFSKSPSVIKWIGHNDSGLPFMDNIESSIVTGSEDGQVRVFDASSSLWERGSVSHERPVRTVAVNHDDTMMVSGSGTGKKLGGQAILSHLRQLDGQRVFNAHSEHVMLRQSSSVNAVVFSSDGHMIATACSNHSARVWDANAFPKLEIFAAPDSTIVAMSDDAEVCVIAPQEDANALEVRRGDSIHQAGIALKQPGEVQQTACSSDGTVVATLGTNGQVQLWDKLTGASKSVSLNKETHITQIEFSRNGKVLTTVSIHDNEQSRVQAWNSATGQPLGKSIVFEGRVDGVDFGCSGSDMLVFGGGRAHVWDVVSGNPKGKAIISERAFSSAVLSPDGTMVGTATYDVVLNHKDHTVGEAGLWDVATGIRLDKGMNLAAGGVHSVDFSPDGQFFAAGGGSERNGGELRMWKVATREPYGEVIHRREEVTGVRFSSDCQTILCFGRGLFQANEPVRLWDIQSQMPLGDDLRVPGTIKTIALSLDGRFVTALVQTTSKQTTACRWTVPAPCGFDRLHPDRCRLSAELRTGRTFDQNIGVIRNMTVEERDRLVKVLNSYGGPNDVATWTQSSHNRSTALPSLHK